MPKSACINYVFICLLWDMLEASGNNHTNLNTTINVLTTAQQLPILRITASSNKMCPMCRKQLYRARSRTFLQILDTEEPSWR